MTIRLRLTLLYSALLIATIVLFGAAVYGVLDRTLRTQVDEDLEQVLDDTESDIRNNITDEGELTVAPLPLNTFQSENTYVQLWVVEDELLVNLSRSLGTYNQPLDASAFDHDDDTVSNVTIEDNDLRVRTRAIDANGDTIAYIQAASSLKPVTDATGQLFVIMGALGGGLVVISGVVGYFMALNALKPISKINETARAIVAAEDLNRRVPYANTHDELGAMTSTINNMLERLEKLFNAQQRFVADISHELRTPITAIQGHVELMQRFGYDQDSMDAVARSTVRMVQLVEDLMLLANADIGRMTPHKSTVHLDTLLLHAYEKAHQHNKEGVQVHLGNVEQVMVEGDPSLLSQLLENLVNNAICYTEADGRVTLSVHRNHKWVEISVQDTGVGIAEKDLHQIFDRFYRVDTARARPGGGSGLGLSIAMWIAQAHDGELTVQSKVGEGSTFTVRLPYHTPSSN
jgi:two-component system, OmpR family, sensor kinase